MNASSIHGEASLNAPSPQKNIVRLILTLYVLLTWFFLVLGLSLLGVFVGSQSRPPLELGLAIVIPLLLFLLGFTLWPAFNETVNSWSPVTLTAIQFIRVLGVAMVVLTTRNVLPSLFGLTAGWGDIFIGLTAPLAAYAWFLGTRPARRLFLIWNILGLLDLIIAVSLGISSSAGTFGVLAPSITTSAMSVFPMSLIPTFLVPVSMIIHGINLRKYYSIGK